MYTLLLLLIFPYGFNGLSCVANGKRDGYINDNSTEQFEKALNELAHQTVDNTHIGRCQVIIYFRYNHQKFSIEYRGNNITSQLSDTLNLRTEFQFTQLLFNSIDVHNTLTYVCSSGDFCDLIFIEYWSQWLLTTNFTQLANQLDSLLATRNHSNDKSIACHVTDKKEPCSSRICQAVHKESETTTQCAEKDQLPDSLTSVGSADISKLFRLIDPFIVSMLLNLLDPSKILESLVLLDPSKVSQLFGIDPSELPELLEPLDPSTASTMFEKVDKAKLLEYVLTVFVPKVLGLVGPVESLILVNMAYTVVIVDTTIMRMNSSDRNNKKHSDQHEYQLNRTISYFCAFNLCNNPSLFKVITDKIESDYNMTEVFNLLSKEDEMTMRPITLTTMSTPRKNMLAGSSSRFDSVSIIVFLIVSILQHLFVDYRF
jgi:hypothetical protein